MERVQILMSTYNGEKFIEKQLDSILAQTYPDIRILIRDDGSTDGTPAILKAYAEKCGKLTYYRGENVGVIKSFFELLECSDEDAAYYAFADQDDDWMPEKIERAVERLKLKNTEKPLLYCSDTYLTDENLNVIKKDDKRPRPSFGNALVQNVCTGCTAVINRSLREIVRQTRPEHIVMHDWWLYLTAELYGEVCYDEEAYIRYRQHGENACGAKKSRREVWRYRLTQLGEKRGYIFEQLEELIRWYPDMKEEHRQKLELVLHAKRGLGNRISLIKNRQIYRNSKTDDMVYRGIVLLGKL